MAKDTAIAWTESTWNPWMGCTKVSPGCANCYAQVLAERRGWVKWGVGQARAKTKTWRNPVLWNKQYKKRRVFVASLADLFDNEVDPAWLGEVLDVFKVCKNLRFLVLTKRIEEAATRLPDLIAARGGWGEFAHMWLGCTAENQDHWDRRVPILLGIAGLAGRFVSAEPLLGPIDPKGLKPDWVIVGGESGKGRRPFDPNWAIPLRDFSATNDIPFFFKQVGGPKPTSNGCLLRGIEWKQLPEDFAP